MAMQDSHAVATDETDTLISSDKVESTAVYDLGGREARFDPFGDDRQNLREGRPTP